MVLKRNYKKEQINYLFNEWQDKLSQINNLNQKLSDFFSHYNLHSSSDLEAKIENSIKIDFYPVNKSINYLENIQPKKNIMKSLIDRESINLNGTNFVIHSQPYLNKR